MNRKPWLTGREVSMMELLDHREARSIRQKELLDIYGQTLVCLTLNIVGPVKNFPLARSTYEEGCRIVRTAIRQSEHSVLYYEDAGSLAGCEGFFVTDAPAASLKKYLLDAEDSHPLGRLMDLDVLSPAKISREDLGYPPRTCLICGKPVFACSRSRTHTASELFEKEASIMEEFFLRKLSVSIGGLFAKAMIYEVTTTPKPGLVDRCHNGAHTDMDIDLFMDSIYALTEYFQKCAALGGQWDADCYPALFEQLRILGKEAEEDMFHATGGVNTHKGLIFSGGILCALAAHSYVQTQAVSLSLVSDLCKKMLQNLEKDFEALSQRTPRSHGERLYLQYGLKGIRGEAMNGYPTVRTYFTEIFLPCRSLGFSLYESGRITLLYLMAYCEDTNIIVRSDYETWQLIQKKLREFLSQNSLEQLNAGKVIQKIDQEFLRRNISPGGSADLLALVFFYYFLYTSFPWAS